ncbi:MFS transporter [Metabacillus sp. GX 13764]|uniref:MFS transporter n=1 Tax=Metabacillus kandeliae TaxID=2900151 RepID=UPI001E4DFF21|nr:MFS transporter [Metabacillus kandeliae]MCD7035825.1 MFS transporter [Metabacillus kandeliae]
MEYIQQGSSAFKKANLALFAGGFCTFANLYCVQPLLPEFTQTFHITPAQASLSLSFTTLALAISMLIAGSLSDAAGRKKIMAFSMAGVSLLAIVLSFIPSYPVLLGVRVLQGIIFAGLPSVAMAYLGEEISPESLGAAMGIYISGNSVGGLSGRVLMGTLTDLFDWRLAMAAIGVISIAASVLFIFLLPDSRHFKPQKTNAKGMALSLIGHLKNPGLNGLFFIGFLLMGSFVTLYNYIEFLLVKPPYSLSPILVSWIFIVYLVGTFSSAWMGAKADQHGRKKMLVLSIVFMAAGALLTLSASLAAKIAGIAVFTFCFFGGHSIASGWVGRRAAVNKAQASSLYLFFYYAGSSLGGTLGGLFWAEAGWGGVIAMISLFLLAALAIVCFIGKKASSQ